ncbi:hypothetical protein MNB_SV-14-701 [hydrothermal vent metagenome]|uniref:Helicase XPB/Ssl2 N-terminal domain-containing protein n=1 Tax=hydrothermal vent metagenome TaxID=652676 RepID=A0A1W1C489_9ZZZZ
MEFSNITRDEAKSFFNKKRVDELRKILKYIFTRFPKEDRIRLTYFLKGKKSYQNATKIQAVNILLEVLMTDYRELFYNILTQNIASENLYNQLIWHKHSILKKEFYREYQIKFPPLLRRHSYYEATDYLPNEFSLITRELPAFRSDEILYIQDDIKDILRLFFPLPKGYQLLAVKSPLKTDFSYSNEDEVLAFIRVISDMLENNLVKFGKTNQKPLANTLKILKESTTINEFYSDKNLDSFVLDMLTRSFKFYNDRFKFKDKELASLKLFMAYQLNCEFNFSISKIFASYLIGVRFSKDSSELKLFRIAKEIVQEMPKDDWVSFENIILHTEFRDAYFNFESSYKTNDYILETNSRTIDVRENRDELFHKPILKAIFFYFGALGLMELKYDKPISFSKKITAKGKPYISQWDGLKYIKLTALGKYIFGFSSRYTPKEIVIKESEKLKFDEFKPIITVDKSNVIMIAKLEPFVEKLSEEKYMLTHSKFFMDCSTVKDLQQKIDNFYKKIEPNPPKVFTQFFNNMIKESNLMNRNLKQVVIELKENKRLLNLFMSNRKLQELFIKAEGYRIIVLKDDIPKLTKIVKDNGFFVEF